VFLFPLECRAIHRSSFAPPHACASEAPLETPAVPLPGNDFPSWSQGPAGVLNMGWLSECEKWIVNFSRRLNFPFPV
jgi:hypothetical protein